MNYEQLEEQLNTMPVNGPNLRLRQQAAWTLAANENAESAEILARALATLSDHAVHYIARSALKKWSNAVVLPVVERLWRQTNSSTLLKLIIEKQAGAIGEKGVNAFASGLMTFVRSSYEQFQQNWHDERNHDRDWIMQVRVAVKEPDYRQALWELCREASPLQSLAILNELRKTGFLPKHSVLPYQLLLKHASARIKLPIPARWRFMRTFPLNEHNGDDVLFSPDGKHLLATVFRGVKLWRMPHGAEELRGHYMPRSRQKQLVADPHRDGIWAISHGGSQICLYGQDDLARTQLVIEADDEIMSYAISADGKHLFLGDNKGNIDRRDATDGRKLSRHATGQTEGVTSVVASPDGKWLASCVGMHITLWQLPRMARVATFTADDQVVRKMLISGDSRRLVVWTREYKVSVWQIPTGVQAWKPTHSVFGFVAISPSGELVCDHYTKVVWYNVLNGSVLSNWPLQHADHVLFNQPHKLWAVYRIRPEGHRYNREIMLMGESKLYHMLHKPLSRWSHDEVDNARKESMRADEHDPGSSTEIETQWLEYCAVLDAFRYKTETAFETMAQKWGELFEIDIDEVEGEFDAYDIEITDA